MATRATKADVERAVALLAKTFGLALAKKFDDPGLFIDYAPIYGGYRIEAEGGSTMPLGHSRCSASELIARIHFALNVHWALQDPKLRA